MTKTNQELAAIAERAVAVARRQGATQSSASVRRSRFFKVGTRNGDVETLEESTDRGLFLRLFVEGRYSRVQTSDLRPEAIDAFVARAIDVTRLLDPEPDRALPEPHLMENPPKLDLDNFDPNIDVVTKEKKLEMALRADKAARTADPAVFSSSGTFNERRAERVLVTSDGFHGHETSTSFYVLGRASVNDTDNRRLSQSAYQQGVKLSMLDDPESIGTEAARRALRRLGAGPVPTGKYDLVLENRAATWLLRLLTRPLAGSLLHQNQSFLEGMRGKPIAAPILNVVDDPLRQQGLASRLFDGESMPARARPIVEAGVLKNYYLDTYYARRLGLEPTTGSASNLVVEPGRSSAEEIIGNVERGVLLTQRLGGNSNTLTGDYSAGIAGFLIEDGEIARPVSEVNIGGKIQDLLMNLSAVGNDPFPYSSWLVPTLKISDVTVAGT